jgi:asparagine synthetase B (glutamine-hydrolysing)
MNDMSSPGREIFSASSQVASCQIGPLQLDLRKAVAWRKISGQGHRLCYLSLFDDEIEDRLADFLSSFQNVPLTGRDIALAACQMEPTDAAIVVTSGDEIFIARGGACNFPLYRESRPGAGHVATMLPLGQGLPLSVSGLLTSVAVVSAAFQNEPNLATATPLHGWSRLRRGTVTALSPGKDLVSEYPIDLQAAIAEAPSRDSLSRSLQDALDCFGRRQRSRQKVVVELSGGFDSTLAAIAARRQGVELKGVSVHFPFYEFRYEEALQQAVAARLSASREVLDGTTIYSYAPVDWLPRLDEPATTIITLKRDLTVAQLAGDWGIDRVLVGEGGDQLFSEDMLSPVPAAVPLAAGAFTPDGWQRVEKIRKSMNSEPIYLRRSLLTYLHDARLGVALKEAVGTHTRSPFSDIKMARCALEWARLSALSGVREGKKILSEAFQADLPKEIVNRRSKVSWDGVCARGYARHGQEIATLIESAAEPLAHIGIQPGWIVDRVGQLARWERTTFGKDDKEVFAVYSLAHWLKSWGLERVSGCAWKD